MKLSKIITSTLNDREISGITCDSRKVKPGWLFACINGPERDGHDYAKSAVENGASAVLCEKDLGLDCQILVENTKHTYSKICEKWYKDAAKKLKIIGVTGTNGKTSITYLVKNMLESLGHKCGLIGTIQNICGSQVFEAKNTTPSIEDLHYYFSQMVKEGCDYCVMEVSSHALDQERVYGIEFETAIFTNLTQDHLDYHKTMENYLAAKKKLFYNCKNAVINLDDQYSQKLMNGLKCNILTYSITSNQANYQAKNIRYHSFGNDFEFLDNNELCRVKLKIPGKFSIYNALAVAVCGITLGFKAFEVANSLSKADGIKGRAEIVPVNTDYTVIIDYAHTPDGLANILYTFKDCPKNRLVVLFGCGGDRDKTKRPIMGEIAVRLADFVIVTSDNPRTEDPGEIIKDILAGMKKTTTPYKVIENRKDAIKYALKTAQADDIIVLAGKGHETYQILNTGKIHFDEREVIKECIKEL